MKRTILTQAAALAAGLLLLAGCVTEYQATVPIGAPEVQAEVVPPQPDVTFVWTPGYWDWRGQWVWMHGYWGPRAHPGAVWVEGGWEQHGQHYVWRRPHWR